MVLSSGSFGTAPPDRWAAGLLLSTASKAADRTTRAPDVDLVKNRIFDLISTRLDRRRGPAVTRDSTMARMRLIPAAGAVLEQILTESHEIWSDGLSLKAYGRFNAAQMRTAWGERHLRRLALVDDAGHLLSSAKRYDFTARLDGHDVS